jgi:hypothetical protein
MGSQPLWSKCAGIEPSDKPVQMLQVCRRNLALGAVEASLSETEPVRQSLVFPSRQHAARQPPVTALDSLHSHIVRQQVHLSIIL